MTPEPDNPFQSPAASSHALDVEPPQPVEELVVATLKAAIRWSLICGISAIPSWVIAASATMAAISGMTTGVIIFAIGYTFLDVWTRKHPLRQKPEVKTTLRITYGTRIAISLLFPVGFFVDLWCGIIALTLTSLFFKTGDFDVSKMEFTSTLMTTLIQGCLLNIVLAGFGLVVYAICKAYLASRSYSRT
ncbi:hypothetical protein [Bremerella sp. P1]|uniref:hypothetical protein n=1 Tax=Bremerella sp. P1 TaxID=3026424 RepID=UPI002367492B|nr:hypothetical protein [Bremerella sp. P1]WDI40858.1 hypothetical protein PSR63_20530 [Bremerella sp. P1]